ncbi:MAG: ABC transporter ATP-binding protein [Tissierellia bacterium]|nr:ABC transporter ATP-binding protein [Tissierellia bacterium]
MIDLKNITFSYMEGQRNLKNISLEIKPGEVVAFIGSSGCGKTTLTRIINGLAYKFYNGILQGKISIDGMDPCKKELYEIGRKVGSIFQNPKSQFFAEIVEDEVAFALENYGVQREEILKRIVTALASIHGENLREKNLFHLSSGERQKVAIASINALNPPIYVFDEPSANLDMQSVEALKELMIQLKKQGKTMIISEHRLYYLKGLVDKYYYIKNGEIIDSYTEDDLLHMIRKEYELLGLRYFSLESILPKNSHIKFTHELIVEDLFFSYKKKDIFRSLSYRFQGGRVYGLTGKNGVGKSTLGKVLSGVLKEKSGRISYNHKLLKKGERKKHIYYLSNNPDNNLFEVSPEEELKINNPTVNPDEVLEKFQLESTKGSHPQILSGGQKQRLTIAAAELLNRDVYIFDEPTSGLDGKNMHLISKEIRELQRKGKIVIIISHDYEFLMECCDLILDLHQEGFREFLPMKEKEKILKMLKGDETLC